MRKKINLKIKQFFTILVFSSVIFVSCGISIIPPLILKEKDVDLFKRKEEYTSKFNVDDDSIVDLFYRDKDYYIKVEKKYLMDATICNFYKKLKFDEEIRRLDFLLYCSAFLAIHSILK